jgi:hypothetical protein
VEVKRKRRNSKKVFVSINPNRKTVTSDSLIYYTKSPDYCSRDPKTGSLGTEDRQHVFIEQEPDTPWHLQATVRLSATI